MGLWRRLLGRKSAAGTLALFRELFGNPPSKSGATVNWKTAVQCSAVLACTRVIAEGIAQVPLKVYRDKGADGRELASSHWAYDLLHRAPNAWQTSFEFREQLTWHAVLAGNGLALKNVVNGRVTELLPLEPQWVQPKQLPDWSVVYQVRLPDGGDSFTLSQDQVFHLRGPAWQSWLGLDATKLAREAIGIALAAEETHGRFFGNGVRPSGVLQSDQDIGEEAVKRLKAQMEENYGGGANAFKTLILTAGLKWQQVMMSAIDAQLLETRNFQVEEIARMLRVMPMMIGAHQKVAGYASVEQFFLAHVVHTLGPWVERWEQALQRDVFGGRSDVYAKFTMTGLLRGDAKSRAALYHYGITDGWLTRNEVRELEDLNPLPGLDEPLRPLNMGPGSVPPPPEDPLLAGDGPNTGN